MCVCVCVCVCVRVCIRMWVCALEASAETLKDSRDRFQGKTRLYKHATDDTWINQPPCVGVKEHGLQNSDAKFLQHIACDQDCWVMACLKVHTIQLKVFHLQVFFCHYISLIYTSSLLKACWKARGFRKRANTMIMRHAHTQKIAIRAEICMACGRACAALHDMQESLDHIFSTVTVTVTGHLF